MYGPANKQGSSYHYESSFVHAGGPSHPHSSKSALFCVTMGGMLKMIWSQNNNRIEETTVELESVNSSDELVTHAALASDKSEDAFPFPATRLADTVEEFLMIAVATASLKLKLLKLEIQWGGPGSSSDKNPMPQNARLNPALVETHLASTSWLHSGSNEPSHDASMAELSHLQVLPSLMDNTGKSTVPPMIVTVRSRVPAEGSYQAPQSILDQWEAVEKRLNLHPAVVQLANRKNSVSSEPPKAMQLRKLDPIVIHKVVVGFQAIQFGKVLVLTMSDGTVEYRDRFTFEEVYAAEDLSKVMNLRQVGWTYTDDGPCTCAIPSCGDTAPNINQANKSPFRPRTAP